LQRDAPGWLETKGIHRCPGEPRAILNIRVALEELLNCASHFELGAGVNAEF
jgi:cytochrome P450